MSASAAAARAARGAKSASHSLENSDEIALTGPAGGIAASVHLKRHFASRCADLP